MASVGQATIDVAVTGQALRMSALQAAVQVSGQFGHEAVLQTAERFEAYLTGQNQPAEGGA